MLNNSKSNKKNRDILIACSYSADVQQNEWNILYTGISQ